MIKVEVFLDNASCGIGLFDNKGRFESCTYSLPVKVCEVISNFVRWWKGETIKAESATLEADDRKWFVTIEKK